MKIMSWEDYLENVSKMADAIAAHGDKIKEVYGIPRGGTLLACLLSHKLDMKLITDRRDMTSATVVVDDIIDKGRIIEGYKYIIQKRGLKVMSMVLNQHSPYKPDFYVYYNESNDKIRFPYEVDKDTMSGMTRSSN